METDLHVSCNGHSLLAKVIRASYIECLCSRTFTCRFAVHMKCTYAGTVHTSSE